MNNFSISTDKSKLNLDLISDFLMSKSYWAKDRTRHVIERSIENSFCFGVYSNSGDQIGFARVVTDFAVFAWLMDIFILEDYRGNGIGQKLMDQILTHPDLKSVQRWGLGTKDAHELYKKFGFRSLLKPEVMMERIIA